MTGPDAAPAPLTEAELAAMPFDVALAEYQAVVARLEAGGLPLEASIALYERASPSMPTARGCWPMPSCASSGSSRRPAGQAPRLIDLDPGDSA